MNGNIGLSTVADSFPNSAIPTTCLFPTATISSRGTFTSVWTKIDLLVFISLLKWKNFTMIYIFVWVLFNFLFPQSFLPRFFLLYMVLL